MTDGSATLLGVGRWTATVGSDGSFAGLELAAMQGVQLRLELLVLRFQLLVLAMGLIQLLSQLFQLPFIFADQKARLLILTKDPTGGQTLQIGTTIPIRADKIVVQVGEGGHGSGVNHQAI